MCDGVVFDGVVFDGVAFDGCNMSGHGTGANGGRHFWQTILAEKMESIEELFSEFDAVQGEVDEARAKLVELTDAKPGSMPFDEIMLDHVDDDDPVSSTRDEIEEMVRLIP